MIEKPDLLDEEIISCLEREFRLRVSRLSFLPLGADLNSASYKVVAADQSRYFLKLRRGEVNKAVVDVPAFLHQQGFKHIIPALKTVSGQPWGTLAPFKLILYPFVHGSHAFDVKMSARQWLAFGNALKRFHTTDFPPTITATVPHEDFSPKWRNTVLSIFTLGQDKVIDDPVAKETMAFIESKQSEIDELIRRAEALATTLQAHPLEATLCHGDIHGWNLLIDADGAVYLVDWDTLIFAPKERDLMFVGAGLGDSGYSPGEEESMFYQGYRSTDINPKAIAYYRYERIIEDIGVSGNQLIFTNQGGEDRVRSLESLISNFRPGDTIETAMLSDKSFDY